MTKYETKISLVAALFAIVAASAVLPSAFTAYAAVKDHEKADKHQRPVGGIVSIVELASSWPNCNLAQPASSTKGGVSVRFIVPSTITTIENSGNPSDGVNIHVSFISSANKYFEAGIIYGEWSPSIPHDEEEFTFYWGRGGQISGVSTLPVVAGHDVRVSLWYQSSTQKWIVWFEDLTSGSSTTHNIVTSTEKVASDYVLNIETNGAGASPHSAALGKVQVKDLEKATKIPNDGVSWANWVDAFFTTKCNAFNDGNYGVDTRTAVGVFKMGYLAAHRNNGYQIW